MKKFICILCILLLSFSVTSCKKEQAPAPEESNPIAETAIEHLTKAWQDHYDEYSDIDLHRYLDIRDTRIIKPTIVDETGRAAEYFKNVDCIVEFVIFSNYFLRQENFYPSNTYYFNDNVVFYKDGSIEVTNSYMEKYRVKTYDPDFEGVTLEITELGAKYNQVLIDSISTVSTPQTFIYCMFCGEQLPSGTKICTECEKTLPEI